MNTLTQDTLKEYLRYEPETGNFYRVKINPTARHIRVGDLAGSDDGQGYLKISLLGKRYSAHRLAFLYMTGKFPRMVDHIDCNKSNNTWTNLREVTVAQNNYNRKVQANNKAGIKNVRWSPERNCWVVEFISNRKQVWVSTHKDLEDAKETAIKVRDSLQGEFANHY